MPATYEDRINGLTTSVAVKAPCMVATSSNLTLYGLQTVDGVILEEGMRVLVRAQTIGVDNGIYCVSAGAWSRALDFDGNRDVVYGTMVYVASGALAGQYIVTSDDDPIDVGESYIMISLFYRNGDRIPTVQSIVELRAMDPVTTPTVYLVDDLRAGLFDYDATADSGEYDLDPLEYAVIAHVDGNPGAWVQSYGDPRMGYYNDSAVPARRLRVQSGIFVGASASHYAGDFGFSQANDDTAFWSEGVGEAGDWRWVHYTSANIFERGDGRVNVAILSQSAVAGGGLTIGASINVVSRHTDFANTYGTWGIYGDAIALEGTFGNVRNFEFNIVNKALDITDEMSEKPYSTGRSDLKFVGAFSSGGDVNVHGLTYPNDEAIRINQNGSMFWSGIMIRNNALMRDDNDEARAMAMAQGHSLVWYHTGDNEILRIVANNTTGHKWRMAFADTELGLTFRAKRVLKLDTEDDGVNYLQTGQAITGEPVLLRAMGDDTDIDLHLDPKGAGVLKIGQSLETTGTMTINRRLKVRDSAGNFFWLLGTNAA